MDNGVVLLEVRDSVAYITMNRPEVLNAINYEVLDALSAVVDEVEANDDVAVVVIKGAGDRAFVAGADIAELATFDAFSAKAY